MITYNGIKYRDKIPFLLFKNQEQEEIEIPLDLMTAERISKYLLKFAKPVETPLQRGNSEEEDKLA